MTKEFQIATANCGNDKFGPKACRELIYQAADTGLMIVNCQEMSLKNTRQELESLIKPEDGLGFVFSPMRQTVTQPGTLLNTTGMGSIVLFDKEKFRSVRFEPNDSKKAGSLNKGAMINTLIVEDLQGNIYKIRVVSAHLDSNTHATRLENLTDIRSALYPEVANWEALVACTPDAVAAGADLNTRSFVPPSTPKGAKIDNDSVYNPWQDQTQVQGKIAPLVYGSLGEKGKKFSDEDTYKWELDENGRHKKTLKAEIKKKREGEANAGSLDHVDVQNNTEAPTFSSDSGPYRYQKAQTVLMVEQGSKRDHNIIVSPPVTLNAQVNDFDKVRNHIVKQLEHALPRLAGLLDKLNQDTPENRQLLLKVYNIYLSPQGELNNALSLIQGTSSNVTPGSLRLSDLRDAQYQELERLLATRSATMEAIAKTEAIITKENELLAFLIKENAPSERIRVKETQIKTLKDSQAPLIVQRDEAQAACVKILDARFNEILRQNGRENRASESSSTERPSLEINVEEDSSVRSSFSSIGRNISSFFSPRSSQRELSSPKSGLSSPESEPSSPRSEGSTPRSDASSSKQLNTHIEGFKLALKEIDSLKVLDSWLHYTKAFSESYKILVKIGGEDSFQKLIDDKRSELEAVQKQEVSPSK